MQTMAGMLSKKGSGDGLGSTTRWQNRYFVINKGILMYFKSKSSVCPRRCLSLQGAMVRRATADDTSQDHAFVVETKVGVGARCVGIIDSGRVCVYA